MIENIEDLNNSSEILVLLSGGLDSAACLKFYLDIGRTVSAVFIDYKQAAANQEYCASNAIANYFNIKIKAISCNEMTLKKDGLINARNAFLLTTALMEAPSDTTTIVLGVHSGTNYNDCSPEFIDNMQTVYNAYAENTVQIAAPFIHWSKSDIWKYAIDNGVPVDLLYSCENGSQEPCGKCLSCLDMEVLKGYA